MSDRFDRSSGRVRAALRRDRTADLGQHHRRVQGHLHPRHRRAGAAGRAVPGDRPRPVPGAGRRSGQVHRRRLHDDAVLPLRPAGRRGRRRLGASSGTFNYIRNSVKALVDAYDGTVTLYLTDELVRRAGSDHPRLRRGLPGAVHRRDPRRRRRALPLPGVHVQGPDLHVGPVPPGGPVDASSTTPTAGSSPGARPTSAPAERADDDTTTASTSTDEPIDPVLPGDEDRHRRSAASSCSPARSCSPRATTPAAT